MNGLDFDQRVLRPWENDPEFYVTFFNDESDQPLARRATSRRDRSKRGSFPCPIPPPRLQNSTPVCAPSPGLMQQARSNLTGNRRDLWIYGAEAIKSQSAALKSFGDALPADFSMLKSTTDRAIAATDSLASWLDVQAPLKTGESGVGIEQTTTGISAT